MSDNEMAYLEALIGAASKTPEMIKLVKVIGFGTVSFNVQDGNIVYSKTELGYRLKKN